MQQSNRYYDLMKYSLKEILKYILPDNFSNWLRVHLAPNNPPFGFDFPFLSRSDLPPNSGTFNSLLLSHRGAFIGKWAHYIEIYDSLFAEQRDRFSGRKNVITRPIRILEIGVSEGGSLEIWKKYFGKDSVVYGIDVNPECAKLELDGVNIRIGSQADPVFLNELILEMGNPDIIIDDGSHRGEHQQISFTTLWPHLEEDGIYVVEDLATSYWSEFGDGYRKKSSFVEFSKELADTLHIKYTRHRLPKRVRFVETSIHSVSFFDQIVVIKKKQRMEPKRVGYGIGAP